jgi:serine kinase of HPr protein (carbohydrate metabolism regulator)
VLIHATAIAIDGRAVLFTGPTLSGKSDLALRAIANGAALIADDLVNVKRSSTGLLAALPDATRPVLAVRGAGIVQPTTTIAQAPLSLAVLLVRDSNQTALMPKLGRAGPWYDQCVPQIELHPFQHSTLTKLGLALERYGH